MTPNADIWLKLKPFYLKVTNSDKYQVLLTRFSYYHQLLQKRQFYRNKELIVYTNTYLLSLFLSY